jgi:hypothetical protein
MSHRNITSAAPLPSLGQIAPNGRGGPLIGLRAKVSADAVLAMLRQWAEDAEANDDGEADDRGREDEACARKGGA